MGAIRRITGLMQAEMDEGNLRVNMAEVDPGKRKMRVLYADREPQEIDYSMTTMAAVIVDKYDPESTVIGYEIEGYDY